MALLRTPVARRDVVIATILSILGLLLMWDNVRRLTDDVPPTAEEASFIEYGGILPVELAIPLFLLVTVPLLWRRVVPVAAVGLAFAGLVVNEVLVGTDFLRCGVVLPTAFFFAFAAGAQLDRRDAYLGLALTLALMAVDILVTFGVPHTLVFGAMTAGFWGIGRVVRSRRRLAEQLTLRTAELREVRDESARLEVVSDRARLSRELDGLLQRRLGELARLADDGARPNDPAVATAMLVEIETESRRTLEQMRDLVGVLRDDCDDAPIAPQPTLTQLEALLVRAKGADTRLQVEGDPRVLAPGVELAAYRIVEHLLAALEDAPGVVVRVHFGDDALELTVSGPARRRAKPAIELARQRVQLHRGTLEATTRAGRTEAVALLPLLAGA
ncbi:MAG: hypothetical protein M3376_08595 [Actinomycetota bacterium]|nr:hypothetical protein [Actinomycetota bacterium]